MNNIIYCKNNFLRKKEYATRIRIGERDGRLMVERSAIYDEGQAFINNIYYHTVQVKTQMVGDFRVEDLELSDNALYSYFIDGPSMNSMLIDILKNHGVEELVRKIGEIFIGLFPVRDTVDNIDLSKFETYFGIEIDSTLKYSYTNEFLNLDAHPNNIFQCKDKWIIIDNEWLIDFFCPIEYAKYRFIINLYTNNIQVFIHKNIKIDDLFDMLELTKYMTDFMLIENAFQSKINKNQSLIGEDLSLMYKINDLVDEIRKVEDERDAYKKGYYDILSSGIWKLFSPYRKLMDKFKKH